jgi:hypothetical protein
MDQSSSNQKKAGLSLVGRARDALKTADGLDEVDVAGVSAAMQRIRALEAMPLEVDRKRRQSAPSGKE